jgi:two-component system chemotaxis sensor kinase CheA
MLASVRSGTLPAEAGVIDLVFDATNLLRSLLVAVKTAISTSTPLQRVSGVTDLVERIKATTLGTVPKAQVLDAQPGNKLGEILLENGAISENQLSVALDQQKKTGRLLGEQLVAEGTVPAKVVAQALRGQSGTVTQATKTREVLKVDLERVDSLVEAIGELVIVESMVSNAPEIRALPPHIRNYLGQFAKITRELQELGMCMRMVPLRAEFQKMARMVRDLTRRISKQVRVELRGENTEMDRSMVEQIADPLVHLIRNAVDHGIETPDERAAAGKSETGTLVLAASHEGSSIVIEISDDGRGINRERVLHKAISQGLVTEGTNLTDSQVFDLLFMPGFSTAAQVTEISGRGVGMDVVKRNIEAVRGRVMTTSVPGRGTTFRLILPLTLAIIDGMVIRCGTERFILPTLNTVESLQPTSDMLFRIIGQHEHILVRGRSLPLIRLGDILEVSDCEPDPTKALVVIVESLHAQVAFLVDEVIMKHQVVIKTLGSEIDTGQLFAGAAILSNGRVGLILNVDSLVDASLSLHKQPAAAVA